MKVGMVGLGRMGANMAVRLLHGEHDVTAYDVNPEAAKKLATDGARSVTSLEDLVADLTAPRVTWIMVPAGEITDQTLNALARLLDPGDIVVDGGNSHYTDTKKRATRLARDGVELVDAGTSGGIWGLREGYSLMVGASPETFVRLEPIFATLAPEGGYAHVGPSGAGHFTKMIHNGVEYALMQAYGEGFELLKSSEFDLDLAQIAEVWRHGSVVRSWLLDLVAAALSKDPGLDGVRGYVEDSGEGRWTVETAVNSAVPAPVIAASLFARFSSRQEDSFAAKLLAALRNEFGGHAVRR
jgi:6-phosphogluconate dehydrogenase